MPKSTRATLAENLKALQTAHPELKSQGAIGKKSGVDQRTVGRILKADNGPSVDALDGLAKTFGLLPWQLLVPGLKVAPTAGGIAVTGLPSWPFTSELRQAVDTLSSDALHRLENVMRSHLGIDTLRAANDLAA